MFEVSHTISWWEWTDDGEIMIESIFSFQNNRDDNQHREGKGQICAIKKTLGIRNDYKVSPVTI